MKCVILALEGCPLTSVCGPMEILTLANSLVAFEHRLDISIAAASHQPIQCLGGISMMPQSSIQDIDHCDLVIIGAIGHPDHSPLDFPPEILAWLRKQYQQQAQLVSICTGAFVLAASRLLDGRQATTHWACQSAFKQHYPQVNLAPHKIICQDGALLSSGGASAYQDMSLFLIRKYFGDRVAQICAKAVLMDAERDSQAPYQAFQAERQHQDTLVHQLQDWLEKHATEQISVIDMAIEVHLSERQFKRRFKNATGLSPLVYLQTLRMEHAKQCLSNSDASVDSISVQSGYEDVQFFRKLFKRTSHLSPSQYRKKFRFNNTLLRLD